MQIGVSRVDSRTKSTEMPSTPMLVGDAPLRQPGGRLDELEVGVRGSKRTHRTSDSAKTTRVVHSAIQRALGATVASSPRSDMITTPPTSGRKVISDRSGEAQRRSWPLTQPAQEQHDETSTTTPISMAKA